MEKIALCNVINFLRNCSNDDFEMVFEEMLKLENENYPYYKGTAIIEKHLETMKDNNRSVE